MFGNIGGKIKVLVIVATVLGIMSCIVFGGTVIAYSLLGEGMLSFLAHTGLDKAVADMTGGANGALGVVSGIVIMIAGSFLVYIAAFIPYGLGQLIQNTDRMVKSLDSIKNSTANTNVNGGVCPYPVYTDEYGRPYYHVPEDIYYTDDHVADGDLVPESAVTIREEETEDTDIEVPAENAEAQADKTEAPEKSANELMDELIRKHDEGKHGKHKKHGSHTKPQSGDASSDGESTESTEGSEKKE